MVPPAALGDQPSAYGPNDSDRTAAGKENSLRTFQEHWANPSYGEPDNPGIYSTFMYGDGQVIEITAGPLGSRNFPTKNLPDMFLNRGSGKLYAVLELNTQADPPQATIEVYRAGEGRIDNRELTWEQINGRERIEPLPVGEPGPDESTGAATSS